MLEDTTVPVARRSASQSSADVIETVDNANNDGGSAIGLADSHIIPHNSTSQDIEIGATDNAIKSVTSASSFDGAHFRPRRSDLIIEEGEVDINAGNEGKPTDTK